MIYTIDDKYENEESCLLEDLFMNNKLEYIYIKNNESENKKLQYITVSKNITDLRYLCV